jgi:hypothetical protein
LVIDTDAPGVWNAVMSAHVSAKARMMVFIGMVRLI